MQIRSGRSTFDGGRVGPHGAGSLATHRGSALDATLSSNRSSICSLTHAASCVGDVPTFPVAMARTA